MYNLQSNAFVVSKPTLGGHSNPKVTVNQQRFAQYALTAKQPHSAIQKPRMLRNMKMSAAGPEQSSAVPNNYSSLQASSTGKSFLPQAANASLLNRRGLMNALGSTFAASVMFNQPANADIDYDGVKYLGGGDKIDVNNANIRVY